MIKNVRIFLLCLFSLHIVSCVQDSITETKTIPAPSNVAGSPSDAIGLDSGLSYIVLEEGTGKTPDGNDKVRVDYTGWTTDGKMFDSSITRGQPATFPVDAVIAGWTEGLQLMKEGGKYRLWIPEALAYRGVSGRPAGMLVFDVKLLEVYEQ